MKKITTLLLMFLTVTFSQAQLFSSVRTNGGSDQHASNRVVTDWLHYDNGSNFTAFGASSGSHTVGAYINLTSNLLAGHINRQIEEVKFYLGDDASNITDNITVEIYTDPTAAPVYTEDFPMAGLTAGDWNTVTLATPFVIDGTELYVGYKYTASGFIIGVDDGSNFVSNVNFYTYDGGPMTSWDGVAAYNFNLQAGVGGATATNDAGVNNVNLPAILPAPASTPIEATIVNYGVTTLNSIDFNYQVDNGTVQTDNLTGLNLASGQSTTVTHSVPWNATTGAHSVDVYVSNFNGNGADDIPANDHKVKTVSVASNSTQNLPLYEEFTSSTCGPCAYFNSNVFTTNFLNNNANKYTLVKYQMDWPGVGDPYYTAEGGVGKSFYGVSGVPQLFIAGSESTASSTNDLQQELDAKYAEPSFFAMTSTYVIDANNNITVSVDVSPYLTGDYTLHCAVVEKTTSGNVGSNGETEFHNVMMKMVPDASGTPAALVADTPASFTLDASLANTNIEEFNDLEVVVFLQDDSTKEVMQSAKSVDNNSAVEDVVFKNLTVYPNPSNGILIINNAQNMNLQILSLNGQILFEKNGLSQQNNIDLSNLPEGIYMAKFIKNDKVGIRKVVINK